MNYSITKNKNEMSQGAVTPSKKKEWPAGINEPCRVMLNEQGIPVHLAMDYLHQNPNRRERRAEKNRPRAFNNRKGADLIVSGIGYGGVVRHKKMRQPVVMRSKIRESTVIAGEVLHYVEQKNFKSRGERVYVKSRWRDQPWLATPEVRQLLENGKV